MGTEINRVRPIEGGRIRFEVECDDIAHFSRVANLVMGVVPEASSPSKSMADEWELFERGRREAKRLIAEQATGRPIPTAHLPPYVQYPECPTLGGDPLPVVVADGEEPPLRANHEYSEDEFKPGGTD